MTAMGHKRSLVRQTDWKSLDRSNALSTPLPLPAENEANDAFDLLEPSRIEREGYFNPAIRRPVDVEHEPRGGKLDQVEREVPRISSQARASLCSKRRHHSPRTAAARGGRASAAPPD